MLCVTKKRTSLNSVYLVPYLPPQSMEKSSIVHHCPTPRFNVYLVFFNFSPEFPKLRPALKNLIIQMIFACFQISYPLWWKVQYCKMCNSFLFHLGSESEDHNVLEREVPCNWTHLIGRQIWLKIKFNFHIFPLFQ